MSSHPVLNLNSGLGLGSPPLILRHRLFLTTCARLPPLMLLSYCLSPLRGPMTSTAPSVQLLGLREIRRREGATPSADGLAHKGARGISGQWLVLRALSIATD